MAYQITLKKRVLKTLETIDEPYYSNIKRAIYALADNPRPFGFKKLKGRDGYRIRVNDYRVIYHVFDDVLLISIVELGHRSGVYE